jgi:hypothetical protein
LIAYETPSFQSASVVAPEAKYDFVVHVHWLAAPLTPRFLQTASNSPVIQLLDQKSTHVPQTIQTPGLARLVRSSSSARTLPSQFRDSPMMNKAADSTANFRTHRRKVNGRNLRFGVSNSE